MKFNTGYQSMRRLSSYVMASVLSAIAMVLLVIVTLDAVGAVIDGVDDIGNKYTFSQVVIYVALTLPARIYEHIPMASLIGCLVGLGVLAGRVLRKPILVSGTRKAMNTCILMQCIPAVFCSV